MRAHKIDDHISLETLRNWGNCLVRQSGLNARKNNASSGLTCAKGLDLTRPFHFPQRPMNFFLCLVGWNFVCYDGDMFLQWILNKFFMTKKLQHNPTRIILMMQGLW